MFNKRRPEKLRLKNNILYKPYRCVLTEANKHEIRIRMTFLRKRAMCNRWPPWEILNEPNLEQRKWSNLHLTNPVACYQWESAATFIITALMCYRFFTTIIITLRPLSLLLNSPLINLNSKRSH